MTSSRKKALEKLNNPAEEAYKVLRTNLNFYGLNHALKTIAVTSYRPNEGKTTTCINLSISIAESGMKALYVDADLRKPMLMKDLGSNDFEGLSNYLSGHTGIEEIIHSTDIDGFFYIPCGVKPFNPTELLNSERFDDFLIFVQQHFDMIIIDTPPLGSVIDSSIIAAKTDGTLIVIKPNTVKYKNALMLKEQLEKSNARILGVVLNGVKNRDYKGYYNSYDYYGSKRKYAKGWLKNLIRSKR
ncbi:MAG TPA: CpsD/CapB family tyrosine-protein kinase [Patescibacteria group bacterium]|nr:CpsD/CapB family tyrosine-protein kinase [Patescibacteria group bacterium]